MSRPFPYSWLPRWPSPTQGFLSWLGALCWIGPSHCHSRKLSRNLVLVRWKGQNLVWIGNFFLLFHWLKPGSLVVSANDNKTACVKTGPSLLKKPFVGEGCQGSHTQGNWRDLIQRFLKTWQLTSELDSDHTCIQHSIPRIAAGTAAGKLHCILNF